MVLGTEVTTFAVSVTIEGIVNPKKSISHPSKNGE